MKQSISRTFWKDFFEKSHRTNFVLSNCRQVPFISHFRNDKEIGAELALTVSGKFSGILTGDNWDEPIGQFFFLSLVTVPEVFAKVNSAQFPSRL